MLHQMCNHEHELLMAFQNGLPWPKQTHSLQSCHTGFMIYFDDLKVTSSGHTPNTYVDNATLATSENTPLSPLLIRRSSSTKVVSKLPLALPGAFTGIRPRILNVVNCTATLLLFSGSRSAYTCSSGAHQQIALHPAQ